MTEKQINETFDSIVEFSEIGEFIDTEVKFYSSGMYLRLAFSVAVHTDPEVFLIDEILAVGDEPFQRKCIAKIKELVGNGQDPRRGQPRPGPGLPHLRARRPAGARQRFVRRTDQRGR